MSKKSSSSEGKRAAKAMGPSFSFLTELEAAPNSTLGNTGGECAGIGEMDEEVDGCGRMALGRVVRVCGFALNRRRLKSGENSSSKSVRELRNGGDGDMCDCECKCDGENECEKCG